MKFDKIYEVTYYVRPENVMNVLKKMGTWNTNT